MLKILSMSPLLLTVGFFLFLSGNTFSGDSSPELGAKTTTKSGVEFSTESATGSSAKPTSELRTEFSTSRADESARKKRSVLSDPMFSRGFVVTGPRHESPERRETLGQKEKPVWRIPQWNSRGSLDQVQIDEETVRLSDSFKSVTLDRKSGAIHLSVDASKDYECPRTQTSDPWIHLLLEQSPFSEPINMERAKEIWVECDFELTRFEEHCDPKNPLYAAQVSWFLYLKNTNSQSKGFHDFVWFGLSLFDNRYDFVPLYAAQDFAVSNGRFIYTLGSQRYLTEKVEVGKRQRIRFDILPEIEQAVKTAHKRGFIPYTLIGDLVIDGMNIGWEIPGVFDVGLTFYHLKIDVVE
ncbi:MAG: hypothetical protein ACRC10_12215 [Thermoguttaceae bacterium]